MSDGMCGGGCLCPIIVFGARGRCAHVGVDCERKIRFEPITSNKPTIGRLATEHAMFFTVSQLSLHASLRLQ